MGASTGALRSMRDTAMQHPQGLWLPIAARVRQANGDSAK
jgi:hypothetical protein